jgi:L-alanine-DL-glutamate epimerase-like enolase superfamily enzyme
MQIEGLQARTYTVPTPEPETDGTLEWDATTIVVVEAQAGGHAGIGYTYGDAAIATLIEGTLAGLVRGCDVLSPQAAWMTMRHGLRNAGWPGIGAMAVSAVDVALWDVKARVLGVALADLLGRVHDAIAVYGSGGFTSLSDRALADQLGGWAEAGMPRVKLKVGREPARDLHRLRVARRAVGEEVELMVDANGAFAPARALREAHRYATYGVAYLEEPVSSDDLTGLRRVRDGAPPGMAIAAGEYHWSLFDAERMLEADAVDVLQADVTRCGGITELLRIGALAQARGVPFSAHCAPAISAHACAAIEPLVHLEWFADHVRVERLLFEGVLEPDDGVLRPDRSRPGLGIELKRAAAERVAA